MTRVDMTTWSGKMCRVGGGGDDVDVTWVELPVELPLQVNGFGPVWSIQHHQHQSIFRSRN